MNGHVAADFAIHTNVEPEPWWRLDLRYAYPIEAIVIHNRRNEGLQARSRRLKVEISVDYETWVVVHSGLIFFGAGHDGNPFIVPLKGRAIARHIRISLEEHQCLHLSQVEVFVTEQDEAFRVAWTDVGLEYGKQFRSTKALSPVNPIDFKVLFRLVGEIKSKVNGLKVAGAGRFGNKMLQTCHALMLAEKSELKYVQFPKLSLFEISNSIAVDNIILLAHGESLEDKGGFLEGEFLYTGVFKPLISDISRRKLYEIAQKYVIPTINRNYRGCLPFADELVIHIRSGDVFQENPHPGYAQPPLAFYRRIVDEMLLNGRVRRVAIVAEDRVNPCVNRLECYIQSLGVPYRYHSGTFAEDVEFLISARHLVFGVGTFGFGICLLADQIETVHLYDTHSFGGLPNIKFLSVTVDHAKKYIGRQSWRGDRQQLDLMLTYPSENLRYNVVNMQEVEVQ